MLQVWRSASQRQLGGVGCRLFASESPIFTAEAVVTGGRDGEVSTADGALKHRLATPKQLGGKAEPGATNPEQLLAAGFSACFLSALGVVAKKHNKSLSSDSNVKGLVSIYGQKGEYHLGTELQVSIPGMSKPELQEWIEEADKTCPFANAVRGNVDVRYTPLESSKGSHGPSTVKDEERSNL